MSKRREKSNQRAQIVCRELRYQLATHNSWDSAILTELVLAWMKTTGKVKYERPSP